MPWWCNGFSFSSGSNCLNKTEFFSTQIYSLHLLCKEHQLLCYRAWQMFLWFERQNQSQKAWFSKLKARLSVLTEYTFTSLYTSHLVETFLLPPFVSFGLNLLTYFFMRSQACPTPKSQLKYAYQVVSPWVLAHMWRLSTAYTCVFRNFRRF